MVIFVSLFPKTAYGRFFFHILEKKYKMEVKFGKDEIQSLLSRTRIFNKEIGEYQMHVMNDNFDYLIVLSNGKIVVNFQELLSNKEDTITPELLNTISKRFQTNSVAEEPKAVSSETLNKTDNVQAESIVPEANTSKGSGKKWIIIGSLLLVVIVIVGLLSGNNDAEYYHQETSPPPSQPSSNLNSDNESNSNEVQPPVNANQQSEQDLKNELYFNEASSPSNYIKVSYNFRVNLAANTIIEGTIKNNATVAGFKNVRINTEFYSKTGVLLGQETFIVMEFIKPGGSIPFRHKIDGFWKGMADSKYSVLSADAY